MFWTILIDDWDNNDKILVDVNSGQASLSQKRSNNLITQSKICENNGKKEDLVIFDQSFDHNISEPITLTISTSGSND